MKILELKDVRKKFGKAKVLDNISFTVEDGEIFGILGPRYSGKSTILNILTGYISEYEGKAEIFEKEVYSRDVKNVVGIVPQELSFYDKLTVYENVKFFGGLYGVSGGDVEKFANEALEVVELTNRKGSFPGNLSPGMRRRLNIACSLSHRPKIVFLDEPTAGIDKEAKGHILEIMRNMKKSGITVVWTSRFPEEMETICTEIALLDEGQIVAKGSVGELKDEYSMEERYRIIVEEHLEFNISAFKRIKNCVDVNVVNESIELIMEKDGDNMGNIMLFLIDNNIGIESISKIKINLDNVFFNITGKEIKI